MPVSERSVFSSSKIISFPQITREMIRVETQRHFGLSVQRQIGNYTLHCVIERGASSVVFEATDEISGKCYAIKVVSRVNAAARRRVERLDRELAIMAKIQHKYIAQFRETICFGNLTYIVTEYCGGGELFSWIVDRRTKNKQMTKRIFRQILLAVQYLHRRGIAHNNITAENVMIDSEGNAKLIDFGSTKQQGIVNNERCSTLMYLAPEMLKTGVYKTMPVDIWSLGILLLIMATGKLPYPSVGNCEIMNMIVQGNVNYPRQMDSETASLVRKMTVVNPNERTTDRRLKMSLTILSSVISHRSLRSARSTQL
jgi:serine/threonine protein kinase